MDLKQELATKGYAIVPNVISTEQVEIAKKLFREWQATIPDHDNIHAKVDPHGIYKHHYAGHTKHAWYLRTLPEIQAIYKKLWNCDKLITSFDGCCYIAKDLVKKDGCCKMGTYAHQTPVVVKDRVVHVDYCIAAIVSALSASNIGTLASCCGHGKEPGFII